MAIMRLKTIYVEMCESEGIECQCDAETGMPDKSVDYSSDMNYYLKFF